MSKEAIVERILADAKAEAEETLREAQEKANKITSAAAARAKEQAQESQQACEKACEAIRAGREAAARLDAQKILLREKRRVIDTLYARALDSMLALDKKSTLDLTEKLLKKYAQNGDEIAFSCDYPCVEEASKLPVIREKNLTVQKTQVKIAGGFYLYGKQSDTDLSYPALLLADRQENEGELARKLFRE